MRLRIREMATWGILATSLFVIVGFGVRELARMDAEEGRQWEQFKVEHKCIAADTRTSWQSGPHPGMSRTTSETLWNCNNGSYWR